jgi:hypothetical protein
VQYRWKKIGLVMASQHLAQRAQGLTIEQRSFVK